LNNIDEVIPYIDSHKAIVKANNTRQPEKWVLMEHNRTFMDWFKYEVLKDSTTSETLTWLAVGLKFDVISCTIYEENNCIFYTMSMMKRIHFKILVLLLKPSQCTIFHFERYKSCIWINGILWVYRRDMGG